jgi:hypothetical protein
MVSTPLLQAVLSANKFHYVEFIEIFYIEI